LYCCRLLLPAAHRELGGHGRAEGGAAAGQRGRGRAGQAPLLSRPVLLGYAAAAAFTAFVYGYEQPALARRYGGQYEAYRRAVPGWWPRLPPARKTPRP
jgi:hypothetical protein